MSSDTEARLRALEHRLQALEDDRAIRELLARYGFNADACRDEAYLDLFTDDGAMDLTVGNLPGYETRQRFEGRDAIRVFITDPEAHHDPARYGRAMHVNGNNLVVYLDGDEAIVNSYSLNLFKATDGTFCVQDAANNQWLLAKVDGRWRIRERRRRQVGDPDYISNLDATPE